ncbi:MAG: hypothetical protein CMK72_03875 [Pseudomonadaceae bacterium]|jgi:putative membrane protein|uniref:DUF1145 domain-containing protein n=1 Tax=Pseudomonas marincola TaxID=437900 RepID=A0A653DY12_9PSED|nr:hypothetical protein [Pseudomonadaceae bacterium]CAE6931024.1 conserved protein of unknown function [Pseudomonas marincola]HCP55783.1 hypothetical protein [Pseudomonas sp.]
MKVLMGLGKLLTVAFWAVVAGNWLQPVAQPFADLLNFAGGFVLLLHILELRWFSARIKNTAAPFSARLQVLLFGVFHALTLPPAPVPAAAPAAEAATPVPVEPEVQAVADTADSQHTEAEPQQLALSIEPELEPKHA